MFQDKGHHFDKVIIETSPHLRCMMTAGRIAEAFGIKEVQINYQASEVTYKQLFDENTDKRIEFTKYGANFE